MARALAAESSNPAASVENPESTPIGTKNEAVTLTATLPKAAPSVHAKSTHLATLRREGVSLDGVCLYILSILLRRPASKEVDKDKITSNPPIQSAARQP
jgi:hypothetical protein